MPQLLEKALHEVYKLPPEKQEAIASVILEELEDDRQWDEAFAASQDKVDVKKNTAYPLSVRQTAPILEAENSQQGDDENRIDQYLHHLRDIKP